MNHEDKLRLLPASIYDKDNVDSNLAKLWRVFASEPNFFEGEIINAYSLELPGKFLDKIGMIVGKQRQLGQSDAEYKSILFRSSIVKEINSLWAMYSQLSRYLNIGIVELYKGLPALKLDGKSKLNGLFRFDPLENNEFLMNGHYYMSGTEPMHPTLRAASFKIYALGLMDFDYFAIHELIESIKPVGVSAYLEVDINVPNCDEIRLYSKGILLSTNNLLEREFWLTETSVQYDDLPALVDKVELYLANTKVSEFVTRLYFTHFIKYKLEIV